MTRRSRAVLVLLLLGCLATAAAARRDRAPGFLAQTLSLPGVPAAVLPADMNGDGRDDLVVLVAYTGWVSRSEFGQARFDGVEGLVEVMSVVDELVERRELRVYPALDHGAGFGVQLAALDLDGSVHALSNGHPDEPLIALTDEGAAAVRLESSTAPARLILASLVAAETSFAAGRFYPELELLRDLDGDGLPELFLPTAAGWEVHAGVAGGFAAEPGAVIELPQRVAPGEEPAAAAAAAEGEEDGVELDEEGKDDPPRLHERGLEVVDLDGDGLDEVIFAESAAGGWPLIYRQTAGLTFAGPLELRLPGEPESDPEVMFVGDLDGDGRSEAVGRRELERYEDPGWRQEVDEAKRPLFAYAVHRLGSELVVEPRPRRAFRAIGYTFGGAEGDDHETQIRLPGGFQDLDSDGRQDLVAITLEFSVLPLAMRVLVARRISLTMNFHVFCQAEDGGFREVPGLDLSGRFKLDLDNLQVRHLSQFAGDFDGDGRADFVQLGRGKRITIHQGRPGCRYPARPDRAIRLARKLRHLGLARILDLDGDGRSDLYVVHPLESDDERVSIPARVDLYLSRF